MKKNLLFTLTMVVFALLLAASVFAQDDRVVSAAGDTYVISAKAGGVNYVEGKVAVIRKDGKSGYLLKSDKLEIGDKVSTGADGKAEILLNPGSFVRLGPNAEFEFVTTDLDNLKLKLSGGSAIFEVFAADDFKVSLGLPKTAVEFTRSGVFRVDVLADGTGKLSVWKGAVEVGADKAEVKSGRSALLSGTAATVAKFDRDNKDAFDVWSQTRAKESAKINARLQQKALMASLLNSYNLGGWNYYSNFGVWVFDYVSGRWCFLPFGRRWGSPYGYRYGFNFDDCRMPWYVYNNPPVILPPVGPVTPTGPTSAQIREERRQNMHTPTFQRFEGSQRGDGVVVGGGGSSSSSSSGGGGNTNSSDSGGWTPRTRNDSDTRPSYNPSNSDSKPSTPVNTSPPIVVTPSRTDTKDNKDN